MTPAIGGVSSGSGTYQLLIMGSDVTVSCKERTSDVTDISLTLQLPSSMHDYMYVHVQL